MISIVRRNKLQELVRERGFASLSDLASELQVSESTIRRDLGQLEQLGTAKRTHGGAFYTGSSPHLPHFQLAQGGQSDQKKGIAAVAAKLIDDGDTILLDGGSTTYELAQLLVGRTLQIVTNSLPVANLFMASTNSDVVMVGGYIHQRTGVSMGPYANEMISKLHVRRAFLSVAGISAEGFYNSNLLVVETEQAMINAANETVVLADSTKFGRQNLSLLCEIGDVQHIVVDQELDQSWQDLLSNSGLNIHTASPSDRPIQNNSDPE